LSGYNNRGECECNQDCKRGVHSDRCYSGEGKFTDYG